MTDFESHPESQDALQGQDDYGRGFAPLTPSVVIGLLKEGSREGVFRAMQQLESFGEKINAQASPYERREIATEAFRLAISLMASDGPLFETYTEPLALFGAGFAGGDFTTELVSAHSRVDDSLRAISHSNQISDHTNPRIDLMIGKGEAQRHRLCFSLLDLANNGGTDHIRSLAARIIDRLPSETREEFFGEKGRPFFTTDQFSLALYRSMEKLYAKCLLSELIASPKEAMIGAFDQTLVVVQRHFIANLCTKLHWITNQYAAELVSSSSEDQKKFNEYVTAKNPFRHIIEPAIIFIARDFAERPVGATAAKILQARGYSTSQIFHLCNMEWADVYGNAQLDYSFG